MCGGPWVQTFKSRWGVSGIILSIFAILRILRQTLALRHGFTVLVHNYGTLGLGEADTRSMDSTYACQSVGSTPAEFMDLSLQHFSDHLMATF